MELADMQDLGSYSFGVWVQVPLTAAFKDGYPDTMGIGITVSASCKQSYP